MATFSSSFLLVFLFHDLFEILENVSRFSPLRFALPRFAFASLCFCFALLSFLFSCLSLFALLS